MPNGGGFGFGDVVDAISSALSDLSNSIFNALVDAVNFLYQAMSFTWEVLVADLNFQAGAFGRIRDIFHAIFIAGFGKFLSALWNELKKLKDLLRRIFDSILCAIKAIIDYHDFLFNKYLRPVLILIQRLRSFLTLLRLLHFKWAARLDARLVELQAKLSALFLDVRRELNTIRGTISLFLDPFGLFDQGTFLLSAIRSAGDLWAVVKGVGERPLTASELDAQARDRAVFRGPATLTGDDTAYFEGLAGRMGVELDDITGHTAL